MHRLLRLTTNLMKLKTLILILWLDPKDSGKIAASLSHLSYCLSSKLAQAVQHFLLFASFQRVRRASTEQTKTCEKPSTHILVRLYTCITACVDIGERSDDAVNS